MELSLNANNPSPFLHLVKTVVNKKELLLLLFVERRRYQKDLSHNDDIITLINLVRDNPALYNYKLQPNLRRRSDILQGWAEIATKIGSK